MNFSHKGHTLTYESSNVTKTFLNNDKWWEGGISGIKHDI